MKTLYKKLAFTTIIISSFAVSLEAATLPCVSLTKALSRGSVDILPDGEVMKLQVFLYEKGYLTVSPNGTFGPKTALAVSAFQKASGFPQTGGVGPMTRAKIKELTCASGATSTTISNKVESSIVKPSEITPAPVAAVPTLKGTRLPKNNAALVTDLVSGMSVSHEDTLTLTWQMPNNPSTGAYNLKIDQGVIPLNANRYWQGTLGSLGLIDGVHTFAVQYCATSSCGGGWSNPISLIVHDSQNSSSPVTSSTVRPALNFYGPALTSTPRPITDKVMFNWNTTNASRCVASTDNSVATDWSGQVALSGDVKVITRAGVTIYSLECFDLAGNSSGKIDIPVNVVGSKTQ